MKQGYIHVYTGNGKGKTTAAIGLAVRAAGAGLQVYIAQFVKGREYSELKALERFSDSITLKQYGRGCFIRNEPSPEDVNAARRGLEDVCGLMSRGEYDLVILDEACIALYYNLFTLDELSVCLDRREEGVEVVITGRQAPEGLIKKADLVTEMKEVKHYYQDGVEARTGIEK